MNNIFVYCEITEEGLIADVSLELISKARKLANDLSCQLEAIVIGSNIENLEATLYPYGVDIINYANDERLFPYQTLPHFSIVTKLLKEKEAQICLFGATSVGRDLAPRISSLVSGSNSNSLVEISSILTPLLPTFLSSALIISDAILLQII